MHAEIIAIGDELTSGQRLDTNSQWISQQLERLGVRSLFHTTVGDELPAMVEVVRNAAARADLVVMTGGLGPTADDLTRQALAEAAQVGLEKDSEVLAYIEQLFTRRGREMPESNQIQAMFPVGSQSIPNPHGTAPGIDLEISGQNGNRCRFFALPGVPAEMKEMWFQTVQPRMMATWKLDRLITHYRVKCFGVGESQLEGMLPDLIRRGRDPRVGITVHRATITLRLTTEGGDRETCLQKMEPTLQTIQECLGDLVFGHEDDELEDAVVRLLQQRRQTLAVCEWGTQGLISRWLQGVAGGDHPLQGATLLRKREALGSLLGADLPGSLSGNDGETARLMAESIRRQSAADYGLAVSALPGEAENSPQVFLGLAGPAGTDVRARPYSGHPDILLDLAAKQALNLLRLHLLGEEAKGNS